MLLPKLKACLLDTLVLGFERHWEKRLDDDWGHLHLQPATCLFSGLVFSNLIEVVVIWMYGK